MSWRTTFWKACYAELGYIDGFGFDNEHPEIARYEFAIVIVDSNGYLRGKASGTCPHWVTSSGGSELWAMVNALQMCAFVPFIVTDYVNLLKAVKGGLT